MQNLLAAVVVLHVQGSPPRHHEHGDRVSATNGHNRSGSYNHSSFIVRAGGREASPGSANNERVRIVVGGSLQSDSPVVNIFKGYNPNGVKFITAAGINPALDAVTIEGFFLEAGVKAQWIPVHSTNCAERTNDPYYVSMVEEAGITLTTFRSARNRGRNASLHLISTPSHQHTISSGLGCFAPSHQSTISSAQHLIRVGCFAPSHQSTISSEHPMLFPFRALIHCVDMLKYAGA